MLSDTVGFVRELPHTLVAAFRSTLDETAHADLLLHVIDAASPARIEQARDVDAVLAEIGAQQVPCVRVYNKIDRLGRPAGIVRDACGSIVEVWLSAHSGDGVGLLREVIADRMARRDLVALAADAGAPAFADNAADAAPAAAWAAMGAPRVEAVVDPLLSQRDLRNLFDAI